MKEFMSPENSCRQRPSSNNHEDRSLGFSSKKLAFSEKGDPSAVYLTEGGAWMSIRAAEQVNRSQCPAREFSCGSTHLSAMKQFVITLALLAIVPAVVSSQTQSQQRLSSEQST